MQQCRCNKCLFCLDHDNQTVQCNNADVAEEAGWESMYYSQGFLEMPLPESIGESCFWFVAK